MSNGLVVKCFIYIFLGWFRCNRKWIQWGYGLGLERIITNLQNYMNSLKIH